ncbi:protein CDC73-like protein [Senna tora]|uniref:Protein CDC73-like protein n=1 Tax=Senna tora TaxID=362788 RepID=A0A835CC66_9FABA|nr:protein CDC73-like protein [Senna tora]
MHQEAAATKEKLELLMTTASVYISINKKYMYNCHTPAFRRFLYKTCTRLVLFMLSFALQKKKRVYFISFTQSLSVTRVLYPLKKKFHRSLELWHGSSLCSEGLHHSRPLIAPPRGKISSTDSIEYRPEEPAFAANRVNTDLAAVPDDNKLDFMSMIKAVERPLKDREALLECKNRDFYSVLVAATKREEERQRIESQQRKDGLVAKSRLMGADERGLGYGDELGYETTPKPKMHLKGSKIGEGVPIIFVPSAFQTLITIYNVKEFLEDGIYIPTDVKVKQMKGARPDCVTVQKKLSRDRVVTAYEVRDKPSTLKAEDWDRVVAVFVLGKEWQFKDWPFKDHIEIFNKIIGFYMRFEDDSLESAKNVKQWNVKIISISKNKRHQDRAAALEVWERLEEFVRSRTHS